MRPILLITPFLPLAFGLGFKLPGSDKETTQPKPLFKIPGVGPNSLVGKGTALATGLGTGIASTLGAPPSIIAAFKIPVEGFGGSAAAANPDSGSDTKAGFLPSFGLNKLPAASLAPPDHGPGSVACNDIANKIGADKVIVDKKASGFVSTTKDYWSTRNSFLSPSCIVLPSTTAEVSIIVKCITAAKAKFAIKAAGHNHNLLFSSVDKGVLISMASLNAKSYDAANQLATYGPGTDFGQIYEYFAQFKVTVVGARLADVGTGLALGGGLSYLSSQYGLACDGFRELEIVLPSGQITTASAKVNPDLFLALKGGGGNAFGVVTKYTVAARPSGVFWGGLMIFFGNQSESVIGAIRDFNVYNTDPKAAIIGTYEKLPTPAFGSKHFDEAVALYLVYDGPDPGTLFQNFTKLPHVVNTIKTGLTYVEVVNMPVRHSEKAAKGDNFFRNSAHHINDNSYLLAVETWKKWCDANKKHFKLSGLDFQPIPLSLTQASKQQGGNALAMPNGPWYWINYYLESPVEDDQTYAATQASFKAMVESVPSAPDLPLFPNDSAFDQNPLKTFSTYKMLQATKQKYDPTGYFAQYTGGWSFTA